MAEETKEQRLNNNEFREFIPYLELEELFLTQIINNDGKWMKMFESLARQIINCNICKTQVKVESFILHLKEQVHMDALKNVKQFYHPVYTYDKLSVKLAMGESVSDEEMVAAIKAAKAGLDQDGYNYNTRRKAKFLSNLVRDLSGTKVISLQVDEIMKITCLKGTQKFQLIIQTKSDFVRCNLCQTKPFSNFNDLNVHFKTMKHFGKCKTLNGISLEGYPEVNQKSIIQAVIDSEYAIDYNIILINLLEEEEVNKYHMMRIFCDLELKDILKLEYKATQQKAFWKPMFRYVSSLSELKCMLCKITVKESGLTSHCTGKKHRTKQLLSKVRHAKYHNITNCYIIRLGSKYEVTTSLKARRKYHDKVIKILKLNGIVPKSVDKKNNAEENEPKNEPENEANQIDWEDKAENEPEIENKAEPEGSHGDENLEAEETQDNENVETEQNQDAENVETEVNQYDENVETKEYQGYENVETEENKDEENVASEENQDNINVEIQRNEKEILEEKRDDENVLTVYNPDKGNVEIEENENQKLDESRDNENVQTIEDKEPKTIVENGNSDQPTELSNKIAAKAKALRDASLQDLKRRSEAGVEKLNARKTIKSPEHLITPDNALVGVEYVVKIFKHANDQAPMFECCLCKVVFNQERMQYHLTGYSHRYKYCEMHYRNAITKFSAYLKGVKTTMLPIVAKLALEIELFNGRSIPYAVSAEEFEVNRSRIIAQLYSDKHACELFGPSFTNILSEADIEKILTEFPSKRKNPKKDVHCRFHELSRGNSYCNIILKGERKPVFSSRVRSQNEKEFHQFRDLNQKTSKRPSTESFTNNVWHKYRREILLSANQIKRDYKEYRKRPDSHPQYDQEWNKFWKERKGDLVSRGINPRNYNFQTDWVPYFRNRLEELFGEALEQAKIDVRVRLNIPVDAIEDSNINAAPHQRTDHPYPTGSQSRVEPPVKKIKIDTDTLVMQWNSLTKPVQNRNNERSFPSNLKGNDGKADLVHVLRLMAAFEDYLGSLGPNITDLLFITLTLEKQLPTGTNLLEQKILTPHNCSLLETAMEKLRGTLQAGLLDSSKQPGLNQVIDCTTNLLKYADSMGYLKQFPTTQGVFQANTNSLQYSSNIQEFMNMDSFSRSNSYVPPNTANRFPDFQNQQFENMRNSSGIVSKAMYLNTTEVLAPAKLHFSNPEMFQRNMNMPKFGGNAPCNLNMPERGGNDIGNLNMPNFGGNNYNNSNLSNQNAVLAPAKLQFSNRQMSQRNMNMPKFGGNARGNLNMPGFEGNAPRNLNMPGLGGNAPGNLNMGHFGLNNYNNPNLNNQNANNNDRNNINNKSNMQNTGPVTGYWKAAENSAQSLQQSSNGRMWQQNIGNAWQSGMSGIQQQNLRQQQQRQNRSKY